MHKCHIWSSCGRGTKSLEDSRKSEPIATVPPSPKSLPRQSMEIWLWLSCPFTKRKQQLHRMDPEVNLPGWQEYKLYSTMLVHILYIYIYKYMCILRIVYFTPQKGAMLLKFLKDRTRNDSFKSRLHLCTWMFGPHWLQFGDHIWLSNYYIKSQFTFQKTQEVF